MTLLMLSTPHGILSERFRGVWSQMVTTAIRLTIVEQHGINRDHMRDTMRDGIHNPLRPLK
jgi:hypothetical protein